MTHITPHEEIDSLRRRVRELEDTVGELTSPHTSMRRDPRGSSQPALLDSTQHTLLEREALLRAIFTGALDAVLISDDHARLVDANPAACELFGLPKDALLGRPLSDFAAPSFAVAQEWRALIAAGHAKGEFPLWRADGEQRELEFRATANILPGRHLSVLRDVTDRKQLERQ